MKGAWARLCAVFEGMPDEPEPSPRERRSRVCRVSGGGKAERRILREAFGPTYQGAGKKLRAASRKA